MFVAFLTSPSVKVVVGNSINSQGLSPFLRLIVFFDCEMCHDTTWLLASSFLQGIELPFTGVGARTRLSKSCWEAFVVRSVPTEKKEGRKVVLCPNRVLLHNIDLSCKLRQGTPVSGST